MRDQLSLGHRECVEGVVEHVVHVSYDQRTVLRLAPVTGEGTEPVTALGRVLFGAGPGESLRVSGAWAVHPHFGRQFRAEECERTQPSTERAIRHFLAAGPVRGIGPKRAALIVDRFGEQTLQVLTESPLQLTEVPGIGQKLLASILTAWEEHQAIAEIMMFLQALGVSPNLALRIYHTYKQLDVHPLEVVKERPYELSRDVHGVGFLTADRIALAVGVPKQSEQRLEAAVLHVLQQTSLEGHCFTEVRALVAKTRHLLDDGDPLMLEVLDDSVLRCALRGLCVRGDAVVETLSLPGARGREIAGLERWHRAETGAAHHVRRLAAAPSALATLAPWADLLAGVSGPDRAGLSDEQSAAVLTALAHGLSVLTGGPGCGKTHTLRTLVELAQGEGAVVAMAAPTGKAAKRLEESTGQPAMTVHRLIRQETGDSLFDHTSVLQSADLVIVDEASMLDIELAHRLLSAVPDGCHLLLVGDTDQLPSISPGRVLRDLLAHAPIARARLTRVFRQDTGSGAIVHAARTILAGELPRRTPGVFGLEYNSDRDQLAQRTVDLVTDKIPQHYGVAPHDVQVLCPGRKHAAGVIDLNLRLQERLNPAAPDRPQHFHNGVAFRLGDRVLQIRNNPRRGADGVFNGATGLITGLDLEGHALTVTFTDGDSADYPFVDLDELLHSYALTVHRSQGSEYPFVIIPLTTTAHFLLHRNLLYTAVTRAQRGVVVLGQSDAVLRAVQTVTTVRRRTLLTHRIEQGTVIVPEARTARSATHGQLAWD
ncbi:ATP-dependent RecD-like DNA helicase [[Kitasatospora] papulosa]|uniref:SF1B family DNA helicase RecD2 n=1 Tax=[Kitasatospora] papulosa TaxID=1464011 RepID=UPI00368B8687